MPETPADRRNGIGTGRLPALVLAVAGTGMMSIALAWDFIVGGSSGFGGRQVIALLFGTGMLGIAALLSPFAADLRRQIRDTEVFGLMPRRWVPALLLTMIATVLAKFLPTRELLPAAAWILLGYAVAFCLVLPRRLGLAVLVLLLCANLTLAGINTIKVDLTGLPLTMLDIRIATANPAGLWDAMNLPQWTRYATTAVLVLVCLLLVVYTFITVRGFFRGSAFVRAGWLTAGRSLLLGGILFLAAFHLGRVHAETASYRGTWEPTGVAAMSKQMGMLSFLAYSYRAEKKNSGDFFSNSPGAVSPGDEDVRDAVLNFVNFTTPEVPVESSRPNIVILMAESTFDAARAFHLSKSAPSSLFAPGTETDAVGPLFVNAVGGGTWITEFEAIVGLDARLFGYSGYYTHSSLSPFVKRSLATHLREKGYRTWAFFPHGGDFYNYRAAYTHYGFETILDSDDLDLSDGWRRTDVELMETFAETMGERPQSPFLAHVLLVENHGPHECDNYQSESRLSRFTGTEDREAQCAIQEYLRRLDSTAAAVAAARDYLAGLQERTGRPFVLLVYGDHQPFSFTGTHMVKYDFDPLRRETAKNITFFHFITSVGDRLNCCKEMIPATLLPAMVSAYAADGPDDVYLGVNFWLYRQCGYDTVGNGAMNWLTQDTDPMPSSRHSLRRPACEVAYRQALAEYRKSGLLLSTAQR